MTSSRGLILVMALLGAVLVFQVAVAEEVTFIDDVQHSSAAGVHIDADEVDGQSPATDLVDSDLMEFEDSTVEDAGAATDDSDYGFDNADKPEGNGGQSKASDLVEDSTLGGDDQWVQGGTHPFSRVLWQRSSKLCYSKSSCKRFFKHPGCCKEKCVNLSSDDKNCGKCGHCCNTKEGYCCHDGYCKKPKPKHSPPPPPPAKGCKGDYKCHYGKKCCFDKCVDVLKDCKNCGECGKKCESGKVCCDGKCKDLRNDCKNCGLCGKKCSKRGLCCNGKCVDKEDYHHCGKCGLQCPYTHNCCSGKCVNTSDDHHHCGQCNKKCKHGFKCIYGMCEY